MIIIFGLGNTGSKYQFTKHNIGQFFVDQLALLSNCNWSTTKNYFNTKLNTRITLLKSTGYMNESVNALKSYLDYYKLDPTKITLIIVHDDSDINVNYAKIARNIGDGGHRGVRSINSQAIPFCDTLRLKIGIRPEGNLQKSLEFVLSPYSITEKNITNSLAQFFVDFINSNNNLDDLQKLTMQINTKFNQANPTKLQDYNNLKN
jgi:peptidyl-tRNA hydrolase, PTH1 family